jgi:hypothetical protein
MEIRRTAFIVTGGVSRFFKTPMMAGFSQGVQQSDAQTMLDGETIRLDGALRMAPK